MRNTFRGLVYAFKRHGFCSQSELISAIISSLVFGFILSFRMWGDVETFEVTLGIYNWLMFSIFSLFAIFSMIFGYKLMAYEMGYLAEYQSWKIGLTLNTFLCFLTNGFAVFLTFGGFDLKRNEGTQIGKNAWGVLYIEKSFLVFWSFFTLVVYTILVKMIFPLKIAISMTTTAYIIAIWTLFPMDLIMKFFFREAPNSNGTCLFFGSKSFAVFTIIFLIFSGILNYYFSAFWPLVISIIISAFCYFVFYMFLDPTKKLYK